MTRISCAATTLGFFITATTGCATSPAPARDGHIDIALTATGPEGATYRLPPNTSLELTNSSFTDLFPIDGDAASLTIDVAPGTFSAFLVNPGGFATQWPLIRQNSDGSIDTVQATVDAIPEVTVAENQATPLAIHFHIADGTVITFARGSLAVSITVDGGATGSRFALSFDAPSLSFQGTATDAARPELAGRFPVDGSTVRYAAGVETTGPFVLANENEVCAPATLLMGGGSPELDDFITEATSPESTKVCISQFSPDAVALIIQSNRVGPPATALLTDLTEQVVAANYAIGAIFNAFLFDGTTLQLAPLLGTQSVNMSLSGNLFVFRADGAGFETWYSINSGSSASGTSSFTKE